MASLNMLIIIRKLYHLDILHCYNITLWYGISIWCRDLPSPKSMACIARWNTNTAQREAVTAKSP